MGVMAPAVADRVRITVIIDNFYDGLLMPGKNMQRHSFLDPRAQGVTRLPPYLSAEHGLACCIEISAAGRKSKLLMDFGLTADGAARNLAALGTDLSQVEAAVLSHGHFDHYGGLEKVIGMVPGNGKPLPLYVGKEAFLSRYICTPGKKLELGRLDPERAESAGCEIREISQPAEILPGVLVIGPIPRVTEFEQGSPALMVDRNGSIEQDDFAGELSLSFNVAGKGLVVLTACAHAGIVNTVKRAVEITGVEKVYAVLGGFHLSGAPEDKINKTVAQLAGMMPELIAPMHCTGFQALKEFSQAMPGSFVLYSAGTQYIL